MEFKEEFNKIVEGSNSIVVTSHLKADPDAVGSILAMNYYLEKNFPDKKVELVLEMWNNDSYRFLPGVEKVTAVEDATLNFNRADLIIFLDGSTMNRFTSSEEWREHNTPLESRAFKSICIDHHKSESDEFTIKLIDTDHPSCASIIGEVFYIDQDFKDTNLSFPLLTGILSDTGNFSFVKPPEVHVFELVAKIIENSHLNISNINGSMDGMNPDMLEVMKLFVKNTENHTIDGLPSFTSSVVSHNELEADFDEIGVSSIKNSYLTKFLRAFKGHDWGFVASPTRTGEYSISFRARQGSINVRQMCERAFGGGGHDSAAGGKFTPPTGVADVEEVRKLIIEEILKNGPYDFTSKAEI